MKETYRTTEQRCIFPCCMKSAYARGLCRRHYQGAHAHIKKGRTTWTQLVALGKALKPEGRGASSNRWFLEKERVA